MSAWASIYDTRSRAVQPPRPRSETAANNPVDIRVVGVSDVEIGQVDLTD